MNQGTLPLADLYFRLKPLSRNAGEVDQSVLLAGEGAPFPVRQPAAPFDLYRIGDAVASRNTHAAIHDAIRVGVLW